MEILAPFLGTAVVVLLTTTMIFAHKWKASEARLKAVLSTEERYPPTAVTMWGELAKAAEATARRSAYYGEIDDAEALFLKACEYRKKDEAALGDEGSNQ